MTGGLPGANPSFPHVVGSDGAGVVEAVGTAVRHVPARRPGHDQPRPLLRGLRGVRGGRALALRELRVLGEHLPGTAAEYVVVPAENLGADPGRPCRGPRPPPSPWPPSPRGGCLSRARELQAGETVLIWGIGGGVALAALQIANCSVPARSSPAAPTPSSMSRWASGADVALNHRTADVVAEVRRHTGGRGADVVVDSVGRADLDATLFERLRRGGRLVVCGATTGPTVSLDLRRLFWHQWSILGSTIGNRQEYAEIVRHAAEGRLWPVVDRVVPLAQALAAFERIAAGRADRANSSSRWHSERTLGTTLRSAPNRSAMCSPP